MDAYEHVVPGTAYPAVILITGYNDPRVSSWELAKLAARLARATTSGRPILLRVDYDAGHGFSAASREQSEQLLTDEFPAVAMRRPGIRGNSDAYLSEGIHRAVM